MSRHLRAPALGDPPRRARGQAIRNLGDLFIMDKEWSEQHKVEKPQNYKEKEETYAYLPVINRFLAIHGMPQVTVVQYTPRNFKNWPPYYTLEENCRGSNPS